MRLASLALGTCLLAAPTAFGQGEAQHEDEPAAESVEDLEHPIEEDFKRERLIPLSARLRELVTRSRYIPDESRLETGFRSYLLYGKLRDDSRREAWAYGGSILYETGWLPGWRSKPFALGAQLHFSLPIHAPSDRDGTLLLRSRQRHYAVFGQSHAKLELAEEHELTVYRQLLDLPYVNKQDSRMSPNTFEAYLLRGGTGTEEHRTLRYVAGYISRIKVRNGTRFVPMGEQAAPGAAPKRGTLTAGALYSPWENQSVGVVNYHTPDVLNIVFATVDSNWNLTDELGARLRLQYTDQRSVGRDLITGTAFDTHVATGQISLSYRSAILHLAASTTANEERIQSPWGSRPSPLSLMLLDFDRAAEDAWLIGASFDFRRIGLEGLSLFANYARGRNARNPATRASLPDLDEFDLTVDYRIQRGRLRGMWLRVRGAFVHERSGGSRSQNELRVILRYDVSVL